MEEIKSLKDKLKESEANVIRAATYGKQLLEDNQLLHTKLEETVGEYTKKFEDLEQEKYSLNLKLEEHLETERTLTAELENAKDDFEAKNEALQKRLTHQHEEQVLQLTKKITCLEDTVETLELKVQQSENNAAALSSRLKELRMLDENLLNQSVGTEEMCTMEVQMVQLKKEKEDADSRVLEFKSACDSASLKKTHLERCLEELTKELQEKECQLTSYFNKLEQSDGEKRDLQAEIDGLRMTQVDPSKKGNSLFAEVEDHRQYLEKQLLSLKTNYSMVKKQCELKNQQISKMKLQLASLLSFSSSDSSPKYVVHLEESLSSANQQLATMKQLCDRLQEQLEESQQMRRLYGDVQASADDTDRASFFRQLYLNKKKQNEELEQKFEKVMFEKVLLSDRVTELQKKMHTLERGCYSAESELIRMKVRYDDLASKKGVKLDDDVKPMVFQHEKLGLVQTESSRPEETLTHAGENTETGIKATILQLDDKENINPATAKQQNIHPLTRTMDNNNNNKKTKSVRIMETVSVEDGNGQVEIENIKDECDSRKVQRKARSRALKLEAPPATVIKQEDCKQQ